MMRTWRPILGFEDLYEVSDDGCVRRILSRFGKPIQSPCKPTFSRGYAKYVLSRNSVSHTISAHKLVWEAFRGPRPVQLQINHKNGIKDDNRIDNLELCSASENTAHGFRVLKRKPVLNPSPGERNGRAKLKDSDIPDIRLAYASGESQQEIANRYGVAQTSISRVITSKGWNI